jgi:hypothetical protein
MISRFSGKHTSIALSTTHAEYITSNFAISEVVWLRKLLVELFDQELETTLIHCDNQSCVNILENPIFHDKSKHADIKCHFI